MKTGSSSFRSFPASIVVLLLTVLPVVSIPAHSQTYQVLYQFTGKQDGKYPESSLLLDSVANLYGTTLQGGNSFVDGVIFRLDPSGTEKAVHLFNNSTGYTPLGGLIKDSSGNGYGTTIAGGTNNWGVVYKASPGGTYTVLHNFTNSSDGSEPRGLLVRDANGNLYGTAATGGANNSGVVFKLDPSGNETVLHTFTNGNDGDGPGPGLLGGPGGNLFGVAQGGPFAKGVLFRQGISGCCFLVMHTFNGSNGSNPNGTLLADSSRNLYGTTNEGGAFDRGEVFKFDSSAGHLFVLYSFTGGSDGSAPFSGVIADGAGNLYGTTEAGGDFNLGTVFKLDTAGNETVIHSFDGTNGSHPVGDLLMDSAGNIYGTASDGGSSDAGVVFKITF